MTRLIIAFFLVLILSSFAPFSSAQKIGNANVLLNDIYLEPHNPKPGDRVSIQSIVYNAGLESTKSVTNVVTVGYFIDGDLVKIDELPNILPGIENGVLISSGPVWTASDGAHTITVILNYHDTLSHLTDSRSNNIVQRIFSIGDPNKSVVLFEVFQKYIPETNMQQIKIEGNLESVSTSFISHQIDIQIGNLHDNVTVDKNGKFSFNKIIPSFDKITPITITIEKNFQLSGSSYTVNIYPIHIQQNSILSFKLQNPSNFYNFKDTLFVIAIYDESYQLVKKINTDDLPASEKIDNAIFTSLPSGIYIIEIYVDGRLFTSLKTTLKEDSVNTNNILIPENTKVKFQVLDTNGKPINNVDVQNWKFTLSTNKNGFTDWIYVLPTFGSAEPYAAKATLPNGKVFWSDSFFINYGEQKLIQMVEP